MKTIIAATIAVALSAPAFAADLGGMKDNTTTGNTYQSVSHSWSGPYIGVHGGYGWNSHDVQTTHTETVPGTPASCKEGTLNSEGTSCTVVTKQESCSGENKLGYVASGGKCYPVEIAEHCGLGQKLIGHQCYSFKDVSCDGIACVVKNGASPENGSFPVVYSTTADEKAEHTDAETADAPSAYIPAVDASTTALNLLQSVDTDGLFGGARVGADYQPSGSRLVFGVLGDFNFADNKQLNEELGITIHDKNSYLLAGRLGVVANDKTLVYGLVGYGWQNVAYSGDEDSLKKTFGHVVAGGGVEYKFTDNLSARLEAQHWFETTKTLVNEDDFTAKDSRSDTRVLVGVNWRPEIN